MEFGERLCYFGIVSNLIMYLITVLHQDVKTAAKNVNEFVGVSTVVPLIAGFFADSYTGSFWMVIFSTSLYQIVCIFRLNTRFNKNTHTYILQSYGRLILQ